MSDTLPINPTQLTAAAMHCIAAHVALLHANVRLHHAQRGQSKAAHLAWTQAAAALQSHRNPLSEFWTRDVGDAVRMASGPWRDAAITLLEVSPRYFRSGYLRDHVCDLLKQSRGLTPEEVARIHAALLAAIAHRPSVGSFKHDCRLAARWALPRFEVELNRLAQRKDGWVGGRARRMGFAIVAHRAGLTRRRCGPDANIW